MANASLAARTCAREDRAIQRALRIMENRLTEPSQSIATRAAAEQMFRLSLAGELREHFEVAFLSGRHQLIARERLFSGSISSAMVSPRIVVQRALALNAVAVIFAHNHPSGDPTPSKEDIELTRALSSILKQVEVRVLDHVVVGRRGATAFAGIGLLW